MNKETKTIAQQIKWDFETNRSLVIKDKNGNLIYSENSGGYWKKWKNDSEGNCIYWEDSNEYWTKYEYDSEGNCIYWGDSNGVIKDKRPKPYEDKVVEIDGIKYKLVKA
jgi:hypothetical protein